MAEEERKNDSAKSRKERRIQWWSKHQQQLVDESTSEESRPTKVAKVVESVDALAPSDTESKKSGSKRSAKKFYVVFVGQIPYSATTEDVKKHFSKTGDVKSVRLATHKDTGKSRGFAYVEFHNSKAYMNGLKMHLSKIHGRPINVEVTSPGRGSSLRRKESLQRKNKEMAHFRGITAKGGASGAMCIPLNRTKGNKKKRSDGRR